MPKMTLNELNAFYTAADAVDREIFAEMRSNVLLVAGEHYSKAALQVYRAHIRENRDLTDVQKLRITKNHVHKLHRRHVNAVMTYASTVTIDPSAENDKQCQKSAQLNGAVWKDGQYRYKLREQIRKYASDFFGVGECGAKLFWDPGKGDFVGYAHKQDAEGTFLHDEEGQPVADESSPIYTGGMVFERLYGFNLLRDPAAKDMLDSPRLVIRKMTSTAGLKKRYANNPEKLKFLEHDQNEEYIVFDATRNGYDRSRGMTLVKEMYVRPGDDFPNGYFVMWTKAGIVEEGELPFGIWPIIWKGCDEHPTVPRGRSIIKQIRPYQAEINRASSQQAQAQITIGDDKILYPTGAKLAPGALLPGVRGISYQGGREPKVLPGRDGSQFWPYIVGNVEELYDLMDVEKLSIPKDGQPLDPLLMLYRSAKQRQMFSTYSEKFEEFMVEFVKTFLELAKKYYPDNMLIPAITAMEYINMAEFRSTAPLHYRIHVTPQDDTLDTKFGQQMSIQHLMQYAAGNLSREDIGKLARTMPFANFEEQFDDFTIDYDLVKNDMLAMERGQFRPAKQEDNQQYMIKKLSLRMRQPDFEFLNPAIQRLFEIKKQQHEQFEAKKQQALIDAKNEYIPMDGPMVTADVYVEDPKDPQSTRRAKIPQTALTWLLKKLEAQGANQSQLDSMGQENLAQLAQHLRQRGPGQGQPPSMPALGGGQPPIGMGHAV